MSSRTPLYQQKTQRRAPLSLPKNAGTGVNIDSPECTCCPYGYHIDRDFVRFAEEMSANAYEDHLKSVRKAQKKMRKSMEKFLEKAEASNEQIEEHDWPDAGQRSLPTNELEQYLDAETAILFNSLGPPPAKPPSRRNRSEYAVPQKSSPKTFRAADHKTPLPASPKLFRPVEIPHEPHGAFQPQRPSAFPSANFQLTNSNHTTSSKPFQTFSPPTPKRGFPQYRSDPIPITPTNRTFSATPSSSYSFETDRTTPEQLPKFTPSTLPRSYDPLANQERPYQNLPNQEMSYQSQEPSYQSRQEASYQSRQEASYQSRQDPSYQGLANQLSNNMDHVTQALRYELESDAGSETIPSAALSTVRQQLAVSLNHMRELEEQVRQIPMLHARIEALKTDQGRLHSELSSYQRSRSFATSPAPSASSITTAASFVPGSSGGRSASQLAYRRRNFSASIGNLAQEAASGYASDASSMVCERPAFVTNLGRAMSASGRNIAGQSQTDLSQQQQPPPPVPQRSDSINKLMAKSPYGSHSSLHSTSILASVAKPVFLEKGAQTVDQTVTRDRATETVPEEPKPDTVQRPAFMCTQDAVVEACFACDGCAEQKEKRYYEAWTQFNHPCDDCEARKAVEYKDVEFVTDPLPPCASCIELCEEVKQLREFIDRPRTTTAVLTDPIVPDPCVPCTERAGIVMTNVATEPVLNTEDAATTCQLPVPCETCIRRNERKFYSVGMNTTDDLLLNKVDTNEAAVETEQPLVVSSGSNTDSREFKVC